MAGLAWGPFNLETEAFARAGTRGAASRSYSVVGISRPTDFAYQRYRDYWGVGTRVMAGVGSVEFDLHPVELADAVCGIFFLDFLHDDIGHTRGMKLRDGDRVAMDELLDTLKSGEMQDNKRKFDAFMESVKNGEAPIPAPPPPTKPDAGNLSVRVEDAGDVWQRLGQHQIHVVLSNIGKNATVPMTVMVVSADNAVSLDGGPVEVSSISASASWERILSLRVPAAGAEDRVCKFEVRFTDASGDVKQSGAGEVRVPAVQRPSLKLDARVEDDSTKDPDVVGNADGRLQKGEAVKLVVTVTNEGKAPAKGIVLAVAPPPQLKLVGQKRKDIPTLAPGESKEFRFGVSVPDDAAGDPVFGLDATAAEPCPKARKDFTPPNDLK